jgi:hypothetical protein
MSTEKTKQPKIFLPWVVCHDNKILFGFISLDFFLYFSNKDVRICGCGQVCG